MRLLPERLREVVEDFVAADPRKGERRWADKNVADELTNPDRHEALIKAVDPVIATDQMMSRDADAAPAGRLSW